MRTFLARVEGLRGWLEGEEFHHAVRVDRKGPGDVLRILDGKGQAFLARIREVDRRKRRALIEIVEKRNQHPPPPPVFLSVSLLRPERMCYLVEKVTEVGGDRIRWIVAARTVTRNLPRERLHRVAWEAVKQCGRTLPPTLEGPQPLPTFLQDISDPLMILDPEGDPLTAVRLPPPPLWVVVGPEGGWTPEERIHLAQRGIRVSLGPLTLRAETAAVVGVWSVLDRLSRTM